MSEADDLARRFFALWTEYLAALWADPNTAEPLHRWLASMSGSPPEKPPGDKTSAARARPPAAAAAAAGASGERDVSVDELARRIDELARRVAGLERGEKSGGRAASGTRRRDRALRP